MTPQRIERLHTSQHSTAQHSTAQRLLSHAQATSHKPQSTQLIAYSRHILSEQHRLLLFAAAIDVLILPSAATARGRTGRCGARAVRVGVALRRICAKLDFPRHIQHYALHNKTHTANQSVTHDMRRLSDCCGLCCAVLRCAVPRCALLCRAVLCCAVLWLSGAGAGLCCAGYQRRDLFAGTVRARSQRCHLHCKAGRYIARRRALLALGVRPGTVLCLFGGQRLTLI